MTPKLEYQLTRDYPQLFADIGKTPEETCMAFGCDIGDGWYQLIRALCKSIMAINPKSDLRFGQIKEKFGGLRIYMDGESTCDVQELLYDIEDWSYGFCEECGTTDDVAVEESSIGWITTLCKTCRRKRR